MSLISLWKSNRGDIERKQIQQLVAIAGVGALRDKNDTSNEVREFLASISTEVLGPYLSECLMSPFPDSGLVLQDIVNELGARLGCEVRRGLYRGKATEIGFDGIWRFPDGYSLIAEVKTTDAYTINLDRIAEYRRQLIENGTVSDQSSVLIVVGRKDTGSLEAQVRGSRYAWDMRLISADALLRLVKVKEAADDKSTIEKIRSILKPLELTKLDFVVDLLASTAEDIQEIADVQESDEPEDNHEKKFTPAAFNEEVATRVGEHLGLNLKKTTRSLYVSADRVTAVRAVVSKEYVKRESQGYWYAFHPYYKETLDEYDSAYIAFGCGSVENILLFQLKPFADLLPNLNTTEKDGQIYWHVHISRDRNRRYKLIFKSGVPSQDVTDKLIGGNLSPS